ncbi:hypothetical protein NQ176_g4176 [Zarea fungicola]|uniref:Uncharacterized protein n=1 Tax=Zarea fungicola TaxID=93591 RepID=A0ACC1NG50_9HYPO|nr:hypothetical protein NQ176_g4176 [Lecanicillium fungicola]
MELVKLQIRRLEIWSNENKERGSGPYIRMWALSLRRREQSRLKNSGASVVDESSTMAIPLWLIQRVAAGYSAEKILSIAERLHKEIKEGHLTQVPEIEFLPDIIGRRVKANRRHGHSGSAYQPVSPSRKRARVMIPPSEDRRRSNFQYRSSPPPAKHYREAQQYHQQRQGSHPWDGSSLLYPPGSDSHYAPYSRRHQIFPPISTLLDDRFSRGVAEYHEHPQSCGRLISGDSYHSGVPLQAIPESRFATYLASRGSHPNHHPQAWTPSGLTSSTEDIHSPINKGIRISNEEETAGYKPPISNTPPTADDTWRGQVLDHYKLPVFDSLKISHREHSPALNSYPPPPPLPGLKRSHDALYGKEFCATHILESQHPNEHSRVSVFESQSYAYSGRYIAKPMSPSTSQHNNERYSNMGVMDSDTKQGQRRENLPKEATDKLRAWLVTHLQHPYPTVYEKLDLMKQTNLQWKQVSDWFINARRRQLPAMINKARTETDKMYSLTARRWSFNWGSNVSLKKAEAAGKEGLRAPSQYLTWNKSRVTTRD